MQVTRTREALCLGEAFLLEFAVFLLLVFATQWASQVAFGRAGGVCMNWGVWLIALLQGKGLQRGSPTQLQNGSWV